MNSITHLINSLKNKEKDLTDVLINYESFSTAGDEIKRSISCLEGIHKEEKYISKIKHSESAVFLPINHVLYSIVLFSIIPSLFSTKVYARPSELSVNLVKELVKILELDKLFPNILFSNLNRNVFKDAYLSNVEIIVFSGQYEHVAEIINEYPNKLIIYNGRGINPFLITENANIKKTVESAIYARLFNSGQDCAGPDIFIVSENITDKFISELQKSISKIKIGYYNDPEVRIGPLVRSKTLDQSELIINSFRNKIVYKGVINKRTQIVEPYILRTPIEDIQDIPEIFSPIFLIASYNNVNAVNSFFNSEKYTDFAMYISIFGQLPKDINIPQTQIIKEKTVLDIEQGNLPFGGYGNKANFYFYKGKKHIKPILISQVIYETQQE